MNPLKNIELEDLQDLSSPMIPCFYSMIPNTYTLNWLVLVMASLPCHFVLK